MVTGPPPRSRCPPHQGPPINVRRGPVPTSRWRQDESLGEARNSMLEARACAACTLKLRQCCSLISGSPPPLTCAWRSTRLLHLRRGGRDGSRQEPQVVHAKEITQHGKYLQAVCEEVPQSRLASAGLQVQVQVQVVFSPCWQTSMRRGPRAGRAREVLRGAQEAKKHGTKKKIWDGNALSFLPGCLGSGTT